MEHWAQGPHEDDSNSLFCNAEENFDGPEVVVSPDHLHSSAPLEMINTATDVQAGDPWITLSDFSLKDAGKEPGNDAEQPDDALSQCGASASEDVSTAGP